MLTLALDTSTPIGAVAVGSRGEAILESHLPVEAVYSESVLPEVDRLVRAAGYRPSDVSGVVVGAGPGSFTGVRIAAAIAKGIRASLGADLFAYSSLAAIAVGAGVGGRICAAIDARRGQVYSAGFDVSYEIGGVGSTPPPLAGFEQRFGPVAEPLVLTLSRLEPATDWIFAADLPKPLREEAAGKGARILPTPSGRPSAAALLALAHRLPDLGRVTDPAGWEPEYVRASSAERTDGS